MANETVALYGLPLQTARPVLYGKIDPGAARDLFIRHALVAGEWESHHRFVEHNAAVIDEVLDLEARYRRTDLLVDDEAIVGFFDRRIPEDVISVRHFDRWWKDARLEDPQRLDLSCGRPARPRSRHAGRGRVPGDLAIRRSLDAALLRIRAGQHHRRLDR